MKHISLCVGSLQSSFSSQSSPAAHAMTVAQFPVENPIPFIVPGAPVVRATYMFSICRTCPVPAGPYLAYQSGVFVGVGVIVMVGGTVGVLVCLGVFVGVLVGRGGLGVLVGRGVPCVGVIVGHVACHGMIP